MTPEGEAVFRSFLQRRTGFVMPEDRWRFLAPRFLDHIAGRGFSSVDAYVRYLEHDPRGRAEVEEIFNILTVRKTNFFRNPGTFRALEEEVIPRLIGERRSRLPVAVWSAGCSTGEEAWSLAMVAQDVVVPRDLTYHVLATDIVKEALARARQGSYPEAVLEEVPRSHRQHLRVQGGRAIVDDIVRPSVEFTTHNLVYDPMPRSATGLWDVIFCRNVLIYFGLKEAREVLERFSAVLAPGGALFLGHAEVFIDMERDYEVVFWGETFFYRRRQRTQVGLSLPSDMTESRRAARPGIGVDHGGQSKDPLGRAPAVADALRPEPGPVESRRVLRPGPPTPIPGQTPAPVTGVSSLFPPLPPVPPPLPPLDPADTRSVSRERDGTRTFRRAESGRYQRVRGAGSFTDQPTTGRIRPGSSPGGETPTRAFARGAWGDDTGRIRAASSSGESDTRADLRHASQGLPQEQVLEAERRLAQDDRDGAARALRAAITRAPRWARPRILLAEVYLRAGERDHALRQVETAIEVEPLEPRAHHLLGRLRVLEGDLTKAEASFRRALYLEPDFVLARCSLAHTYRDTGQPDRACKELRTVLRALRGLPGAQLAPWCDGVPVGELFKRCEAEIDQLGGNLEDSGTWFAPPPAE